jgi:S-adenosylmethionine hydrolase
MAAALLTFLTDFGLRDHYVAVMKAAALGRAPDLGIVDISHDVPPQDVERGAFLLAEAAPWFPVGTVHVVVVDPGVGTARRGLVARVDGQVVVAPDNGVITALWARATEKEAWDLSAPGLGLPHRSATFHGRDLFAPVGASLAVGALRPEDCGAPIEPSLRPAPEPRLEPLRAVGRVQTIDGYGTLVSDLRDLPVEAPRIELGGRAVPWVRTYGEAADGALVALIGSGGWVEIARVNGSAAEALGLGVGAAVTASW